MNEQNYTSRLAKYKKAVPALFVIVTILTLVGTLFPSNYNLPSTFWQQDKLGHFIIFLAWTILFGGVLTIKQKKKPKLPYVLLCSALFGIAIEMLQLFIPTGRNAELYDFIADLLGSLAALGILTIVFKKIFPEPSEPESN